MILDGFNFFKCNGTGNDFLITWLEEDQKSPFNVETVKALCNRRSGLGADGLVALKKVPQDPTDKGRPPEFRWDFYNSDGSTAAMCGNAARCVGLFVNEELKIKNLTLYTKSGPVKITVLNATPGNATVEVQLAMPRLISEKPFLLINSGVPHIIESAKFPFDKESLKAKALDIKKHPEFPKSGSNITFVSPLASQNEFASITFERGVDDFTLSCGTGALASAFFYEMTLKEQTSALWKVSVPGGLLNITFADGHATLTGPAVKEGP
jgi:diaminopimelate epimerase